VVIVGSSRSRAKEPGGDCHDSSSDDDRPLPTEGG
jgi:hypothetical protein